MKNGISLVCLFFLSLVLVPGASAKNTKSISLKYSDHAPPGSAMAVFIKEEWVPRVQAQLIDDGYDLDITYYHSSSLYKYQDQVQACEKGLIDMTLFVLTYELARTPLHEVIVMPFMGYTYQSANKIWFDLHDTIPEFEAELRNFKEVFHEITFPRVLNANKELRVPEDFKGLKIQSAGMVADMFRANGAIPIRQAPGDWYTSLDRELINVISLGIAGVTMFRLEEVIDVHIIPTGENMGFVGTSMVMNRHKFDKLPEPVQKVINDNVVWASRRITQIEEEQTLEAEKICRAANNSFIQLTVEETQKWREAFEPLKKNWMDDMTSKGLPGKKVYNTALRLSREYALKKN